MSQGVDHLAASATLSAGADGLGVWWRALSRAHRPPPLPRGLDAAWHAAAGWLMLKRPLTRRYLKLADRVLAWEGHFAEMGSDSLRDAAEQMRGLIRRGRETLQDRCCAFALVREVARRELGLLAHREQVAAALAMDAGHVVEMATGEGKTLAATLPATLAGWRGRGCHVMTVNDYLARRDAQWMGGIYRFCGLRVGCVTQEMDVPQRRQAYAADITYCTHKEAAADFLRDRLALGGRQRLSSVLLRELAGSDAGGAPQFVMRGLEQAIVDEADSVLIDEAVTPLILCGDAPNPEQAQAYQEAAQLAAELEAGRDYRVDHRFRQVELTRRGRHRLARLCQARSGVWAGARRREELIQQALTARHLFLRDTHYVVQDGRVVIVDESTGRLMPDRTWRDGLHAAIEAKEGLTIRLPKATLARISFQRFFRLYRRLCGMTGTAWESRQELWRTYRQLCVRIPTHRRCIRRDQPDRVFVTQEAKWRAVVEEIRGAHAQGRPVLVGTRSVEASERLSARLGELGLEHQVLNAVRHEQEARIIAQAGQAGRITVATNMAGRGTDIKLGAGVAERGGLHVIMAQRHESRRVDRQLLGRAGRQGDPGTTATFVSLEDELLIRYAPRAARRLMRLIAWAVKRDDGELAGFLPRLCLRFAQARAQRLAHQQRLAVLRADDWSEQFLGFTRLNP